MITINWFKYVKYRSERSFEMTQKFRDYDNVTNRKHTQAAHT